METSLNEMLDNICKNCMYYDQINIEETNLVKLEFESKTDTIKGQCKFNNLTISYISKSGKIYPKNDNLEWDYFNKISLYTEPNFGCIHFKDKRI